MNLAVPINDINLNNVFFQEAIKNTIMDDSSFIRVIYSNEFCILNGICIEFNIPLLNIDKTFNKYKCTFDSQTNNSAINALINVENNILSKCNFQPKQAVFRITEQLKNGFIKVPNINTNINTNLQSVKFLIKISGVWSTDMEYGLTYKFTQV